MGRGRSSTEVKQKTFTCGSGWQKRANEGAEKLTVIAAGKGWVEVLTVLVTYQHGLWYSYKSKRLTRLLPMPLLLLMLLPLLLP